MQYGIATLTPAISPQQRKPEQAAKNGITRWGSARPSAKRHQAEPVAILIATTTSKLAEAESDGSSARRDEAFPSCDG